MERSAMKHAWAEFRFQDFLNAGLGPEAMNREALASAYGALSLSLNTPGPEGGLAQVPENTLGVQSYSQGWLDAFRVGAKPWL